MPNHRFILDIRPKDIKCNILKLWIKPKHNWANRQWLLIPQEQQSNGRVGLMDWEQFGQTGWFGRWLATLQCLILWIICENAELVCGIFFVFLYNIRFEGKISYGNGCSSDRAPWSLSYDCNFETIQTISPFTSKIPLWQINLNIFFRN